MTKQELREALLDGKRMDELFEFSSGQECEIYKSDEFCLGNDIIYIPDLDLNHIPSGTCNEKEVDEILYCCYTGNDFLAECDDNLDLALRLFWYVDWQHPCSGIDEVIDDEEYVEMSAARAITLLRGVATWMSNNIGVDSAIGNLFWLGATPEETIAIGFDEAKVKALYATYEEDALPWI